MSRRVKDPVSDGLPGSVEIGFAVPETYNASRILWDNLAKGFGNRIAVRSPSGDLSYVELTKLAAQAGNLLLRLGLEKGDRVVLLQTDTPLYVAFIFGAIRAGLVPVLINTLTPPDLLNFYILDAQARTIVTDTSFAELLGELTVTDTTLKSAVIVDGGANGLEHIKQVVEFDVARSTLSNDLPEADTHRDEMAFWMYSSGSTGRPKGIVHLQHDMLYTAQSYAANFLKLTPEDTCFSVPKIFFAYGFGNSLTFPFLAGASSVLFPARPDPDAIVQVVQRYKPSVFFALPTVYTALVNASDRSAGAFSSVRLCVSAAEVLASETFNAWKALTGLEIVEGLGSTEVLHIYLSNSEVEKRLGSAGRRVPGYEVRLTDPEGIEVQGAGQGVLWVRGHSNAPLYWNRPDKTAETMRDDWIYTGDRFERDTEGFYYFRGRADDLIKVSGQWVYPLEVELCLADHPGVREACVMGVELPDRRMTLKAFVVPKQPVQDEQEFASELQNYVKGKLLPYKYPRQVVLMTDLPKTGTGKIDRQSLLKGGTS